MLKKSYVIILMAILLLAATGCTYLQPTEGDAITGEVIQIGDEDTKITLIDFEDNNTAEADNDAETDTKEETTLTDAKIKIEKVEGNLITIKPDAYDPDGDVIKYTFSEPFDKDGEWQTEEGDAGNYEVTVVASDGKLSTTEKLLVVVKPTNKAPIMKCPEFSFKETDTVRLNCDIKDPEGQEVIVTYSGWMTSYTKETDYEDEGTYKVTIKADDGERVTKETVKVIIENLNRAPEIDMDSVVDIEVKEGDLVKVVVKAEDAEDDKLSYEYGEPLDKYGKWQTEIGDTGTFDSYVIVSDGDSSVKEQFEIVVVQTNTAPKVEYEMELNGNTIVLTSNELVEISEGDTINLEIDSVDREGDKIEIEVDGFISTMGKTIIGYKTVPHELKYLVEEDSEYCEGSDWMKEDQITITADDGNLVTTNKIKIVVCDKNQPPTYTWDN